MTRWNSPEADPLQDMKDVIEKYKQGYSYPENVSSPYRFVSHTWLFGKRYAWVRNTDTNQLSLYLAPELEEAK